MIVASVVLDGEWTRFECGGRVRKHGVDRPEPCQHFLGRWRLPVGFAPLPQGVVDCGVFEVKCRRCKAVNEMRLGSSRGEVVV